MPKSVTGRRKQILAAKSSLDGAADKKKGDAVLVGQAWLVKKKKKRGEKRKHDGSCSRGRKYRQAPLLGFKANVVVAKRRGRKTAVPRLMKKLDGWNNLPSTAPLLAATQWPLFGQQAETFRRAVRLGRWATTNTTLGVRQKERNTSKPKHPPTCVYSSVKHSNCSLFITYVAKLTPLPGSWRVQQTPRQASWKCC